MLSTVPIVHGAAAKPRAHGSAHFGKEHGAALSLSLYAPQPSMRQDGLEDGPQRVGLVVDVVKRSMTTAGTVSAIVGALGLGAGQDNNAAPAFVERRTG